jgi:hypothetical protein
MMESDIEQLRRRAHSIQTLPSAARKRIARYQALRIQQLRITCPYHINSGLRAKNRALVGKGRPEDIEAAAEYYLSKYQMHAAGDVEQLRRYMLACGLGVDCSGFAAWILDCMTQDILQKSVWQCLTFPGVKRSIISKLRPIENISANLLTGTRNSQKIADLHQVRPGDMVRLIGGGHVILISEVGRTRDGQPLYFQYVQSSVSYGDRQGVNNGLVIIDHPVGYLLEQQWVDGRIYAALQENVADSRIVRLKAVTNSE